ncbi:MAG: hypothetical protein IJS86_06540 [Lachnospiraceae bacterium]|nr:hypothetical protein [Lachnospiraceae bacterium]
MEEQTAAVVKGNNENDSNGTVSVTGLSLPESTAAPAQSEQKKEAGVNNVSNGGTKMADQVNNNAVAAVDVEKIEELLKKIERSNKKQVRWARTAGIFMILLFVVIGGALFLMVPKVIDTLANIDVAVNSANEVLKEADAAISDINEMSRSLTSTSDELNSMLTENSTALASAISQIEAIDFDSLNKAIVDLETTVGPLANFMGRFSKK